METIKHITSSFVAQLLVLAIVFPSVLQFSHIFEDHEHTFCGNVETHLHEQELDCDPTIFVSTVFRLDHTPLGFKVVPIPNDTPNKNYTSQVFNNIPQSRSLRGPPIS